MNTETTQTDTSPCAVGTSDTVYETERRPSYARSRFNACRWQTTRDSFMVCFGDRCKYRFCGFEDDEMPPAGSACVWERVYAMRLLAQFDELFPADGVGQYMDDRDHHRREWTYAHLLANRAGTRARTAFNEAMDAVSNRGNMPIDRRPFERHALAMRYRAAARNRLEAVWAQLPVIEKRIRDKRIIRAMIVNGYWHIGDPELPNPDNAPDWIIATVDRELA